MILWKWPSFSFEKNKSGIHTRLDSVNVKYFKRPETIEIQTILTFKFKKRATILWVELNKSNVCQLHKWIYLRCRQILIVHLTIALEM